MSLRIRRWMLITGPVCWLVGLFFFGVGHREGRMFRQLGREGLEVRGEPISRRIVRDRWGSPSYKISIEYHEGGFGPTFLKEFDVPLRVYTHCEVCDPIMVRHLAGDPSVAEVSDADPIGEPAMHGGMILAALGVVVSSGAIRSWSHSR